MRRPLVILISVDTLRADHLGLYGYSRATSPVLDQLASESVAFEDASSTSSWTLPAHASLLRGLFPERHGLTTSRKRLDSQVQVPDAWANETVPPDDPFRHKSKIAPACPRPQRNRTPHTYTLDCPM